MDISVNSWIPHCWDKGAYNCVKSLWDDLDVHTAIICNIYYHGDHLKIISYIGFICGEE